jgi:hypothetical protein
MAEIYDKTTAIRKGSLPVKVEVFYRRKRFFIRRFRLLGNLIFGIAERKLFINKHGAG